MLIVACWLLFAVCCFVCGVCCVLLVRRLLIVELVSVASCLLSVVGLLCVLSVPCVRCLGVV